MDGLIEHSIAQTLDDSVINLQITIRRKDFSQEYNNEDCCMNPTVTPTSEIDVAKFTEDILDFDDPIVRESWFTCNLIIDD